MINIVKGNKKLKVANRAYENCFKLQGWKIEGQEEVNNGNILPEINNDVDGSSVIPNITSNVIPDITNNDNEMDNDGGLEEIDDENETIGDIDLSTIPVSELTKKQTKKYAKQLNISVKGKSVLEVKELIKKVTLEE